jgi:hypothetical protein
MVIPKIENGNLILNVKGIGKFLALKSELVIPLTNIKGVTADPGAFDMPKGLRAPGTAVPGLIYAGTFYHDGDKVFWDVRNRANALVIELANEEFNRLIVEVADVNTTIRLIEANINK